MTFSIVAADREAKEVGFAIASCCWDAGQVCMAQAEAGAIASQASGNVAFLPLVVEELEQRQVEYRLGPMIEKDLDTRPGLFGSQHADKDAVEATRPSILSP